MFEQIVILDQTGLQDWALDELEKVSRLPLRIYESDPESKNDIIGRIGLADCVFLSWRAKLSSEVLSHCKSLYYVGMCCSIYSPESANVDIEYALENNIVVKGIRDYGDEGVVEYILSELIQLLKGLGSHQWKKEPVELTGRSIGIIGLGTTGSMLAKQFQALGANVCYFSRNRKPEIEKDGIKYLSLQELLSTVDILSFHLPRGSCLLGEKEFEHFGDGKIIINTSLGLMVEKPALEKWISRPGNYAIFDGDGIDKYFAEFKKYERMISAEVVSGWTREARERLSRKVIDNVLGGAKKITLLLIFLTLCFWQVNGQDITYGSNDGQHVNISDTKIYYEEYGSGPALFLLHGGFGSIHDFQQVIPDLANHFRVIAVDSPGHGRSEQADSLSFELMANYVSEMIDLLHLDSLYIIGYSDGGNTALLLSNQRPDKVKRVVASGANSKMSGLTPEVLGYLEMVNPEFIEASQQEWLMDYMSKSPEKDNWKKYIADMIKMYSNEVIIDNKQLANISGRVLLLYGDRDVIKLEHGLEIYNAIPGSRFCVLPNTPHEVFSANPALVNEIGIAFLKE